MGPITEDRPLETEYLQHTPFKLKLASNNSASLNSSTLLWFVYLILFMNFFLCRNFYRSELNYSPKVSSQSNELYKKTDILI